MSTIRFLKNHQNIEAREGENLMKALLENKLPVASSCYGKGVCARCRVQVIDGADNLSKPNALEKLARERLADSSTPLEDDERLSCQTRLLGDVKIHTTYW
jgi:ferredoxin, 2Fe-2S